MVGQAAQDTEALTTTDVVRAEISEAMDAIAAYSEQEYPSWSSRFFSPFTMITQ